MTRKIATISEGELYGTQTNWQSIRLDSPQWFAWLEDSAHRSFAYALHNLAYGYIDGFVTVRKERRRRGRAYWTAYRRIEGRLSKVYLGPSAAVTQAGLSAAAARLQPHDDPLPGAANVSQPPTT